MKNQAFVYTNSRKLFVETMQKTFGQWLREEINRNDISNAELARRVDISPTYIGNLLRDYSPNSKSGSIRASEPLVEKIASALGADINEARLAAGYATTSSTESIEILDGISLNLDQGKYSEEMKDRIINAIRMVTIGALIDSGGEEIVFNSIRLKEIYEQATGKEKSPIDHSESKQSTEVQDLEKKTISTNQK